MEARKKIKLDKHSVRIAGESFPLGPTMIEMPEGYEALGVDSVSSTVCTIEHSTAGKLVVVIAVANLGGDKFATLTQMTGPEARSFAASIVQSANECDGGQVKN